jgi:type IV pilus assembly protein PilA
MRITWVLLIAVLHVACGSAIEKLQDSRIAANEASAIGTLRLILTGEVVYSSSCSSGGFAVSLTDLAKPPRDGQPFVSSDLAGGATISKSGYKISLAKDAAPDVKTTGTAAETCNGSANAPASSFFASAQPETPGQTGRRYFAIDGRGEVYASTSPIANPIVPSATVTPLQ